MKNIVAFSLITVLATASATAEQDPSYNFIEAGFAKENLNLGDGFDIKLDGIKIRGNVEINDNFYFNGGYQSVANEYKKNIGYGDIDFSKLNLGIGYKVSIAPGTSFFTHLDYLDWEFKRKSSVNSLTVSDDGYQLGAGIRYMVTSSAEVYGEIAHIDFDGEVITDLTVGTRVLFDNNFGGYIEYHRNDNSSYFQNDGYSLGVSYQF